MKTVKSIPVNMLDDSGWEKYFNLVSEINKKYYPDESIEDNYIEFKTARLKDCEKHKANEYLIINNTKPCGWFALKRDSRSSMLVFDSVNDEVTDDEIRAIFDEMYNYINIYNLDTTYYWSFNSRCINALKKAGAVINEEIITTKLERNEMNPAIYENILNSTPLDGYTLKYFTTFPVNHVDNFTALMNEVFVGMNKLNPYGIKIPERNSDFWIRKYEYENGDGSHLKMFMLFDKDNNIAAYCSLFVDDEYPLKVRHEGGFTVVAPSHRGKGFARFLKAKIYLMLLEENPNFKFITTDTMPWNKYMYSINEEFGFKPYLHGVDLKMTKDSIEKYLKIKN